MISLIHQGLADSSLPTRQNVGAHPRVGKVCGKETFDETFSDLTLLSQPQYLRVALKAGKKILFVNLSDVMVIQAQGRYVRLQQKGTSCLLRESISVVARKLEPFGFTRIHRSTLVNTLFVKEISTLSSGEYCLQIEGGKEYTITRTYRKNLKALAQFWIGAGASFPG